MILEWLGRLVAPLRCAACDATTDLLFCEGCTATIEPAADAGAGAFSYGGAMAEAIVRLKYKGRSDLARGLGRAMVDRIGVRVRGGPGAGRAFDIVVPVPLHALRAAERGFNQSALLARPIARALRIPLGARVLERIRHTPQQASLERADRLVNVRAAFRCREPHAVAGKRVLVVDDVQTTGATIAECTRTLADAGALAVIPFVLAVRDELPEFR